MPRPHDGLRAALLFAIAAAAAGPPRPLAGAIEEIWHRRIDSPTEPSRLQVYSTPPRRLVDGSLLIVGRCVNDTCFVRIGEGGQVLSRVVRRVAIAPHVTDPWGGVFFLTPQGVEKVDAYSARRLFLHVGLTGNGLLTPSGDLVVNDPQQGLTLLSGVDGRTLWTGLAAEKPPQTALMAVTESMVFLAAGDGTVSGYRLSDGVRTLRARHDGPARSAMALTAEGNRCFLAALEGSPNPIAKVYAFHGTNGAEWISPSLGPALSSYRLFLSLNRRGHLFVSKLTRLYQNRLAEITQVSVADGSVVFGPSFVGPPPPSPPGFTEESIEALAVDDEGDALVSISRFSSAGLVVRFSHTTGEPFWPFPPTTSALRSSYAWLPAAGSSRGVVALVGPLRGTSDLVHLEISGATGTPLGRPTIVEGAAEAVETAYAVVSEPGGGLAVLRRATGRTILDRFDAATGERTSRAVAPAIPFTQGGLRLGPAGEFVLLGTELDARILTRLLPDGQLSWQRPAGTSAPEDLQISPGGDVYVFTEKTYRKFEGATGASTPAALPFPLTATRSLARIHTSGDVIVVSELPPAGDPSWVVTRYGPQWSPVWTSTPVLGRVVGADLQGNSLSLAGTARGQAFVARLDAGDGHVVWGPQAPPGEPSSEPPVCLWLPNGELVGTGRAHHPSLGEVPMAFRLRADGTEAWHSDPFPVNAATGSRPRIQMVSGDPVVLVPMAAGPAPAQVVRLDGDTGAIAQAPVPLPLHPTDDKITTAGARAFALLNYDELMVFGDLPTARPLDGELPSVTCGEAMVLQLRVLNLTNAEWAFVSGALPPGLVLRSDGLLEGRPAGGSYAFRLRVLGTEGSVVRDYTLEVGEVPTGGIEASPAEISCAGASVTLTAPDGFTAYAWTPGGETTRTIVVSPRATTTYGVVLTNADGCVSRAARSIAVSGDLLRFVAPEAVAAAAEFEVAVATTGLSSIAWTVVNGTLVAGQGTSRARVRAGAEGFVMVRVEASREGCASLHSVVGVSVQEKLGFYTIEPCRLLDTRESDPLSGDLPTREFQVAGRCGIPANARVVVVNLTALEALGAWGIWLSPAGADSALSFGATASLLPSATKVRTVPSMVALPRDGSGRLMLRLSGPGSSNVIVDVSGYFGSVSPPGREAVPRR